MYMTQATALGTEQTFIAAYNLNAALRDAVDKALMRVHMGLEEFEKPTTWSECLDCLEEVSDGKLNVEIVQGIGSEMGMLYPLATYGWDGGNAINTEQINLTALALVHVEGGPCANIVKRTDSSYPGVAIHYAEGKGSLTIQLF